MFFAQRRRRILSGWTGVVLLSLGSIAFSQTSAPNSEDRVMGHLNLVLRWSRQWDSTNMYLSRPGDEIYLENGRDIAQQVVRLEFKSALAQAALLGNSLSKNPSSATDTQNDSDAHSIAQMQQRTAQQIQNLQTQLDTANSRLSRG